MENKNNYYYIVVSSKDNNEKRFASVLKVSTSINLVHILKNFESANIVPTRKEALEIALEWNKAYKANNNYLYGDWRAIASVNDAL